jgi:hypothetical protein
MIPCILQETQQSSFQCLCRPLRFNLVWDGCMIFHNTGSMCIFIRLDGICLLVLLCTARIIRIRQYQVLLGLAVVHLVLRTNWFNGGHNLYCSYDINRNSVLEKMGSARCL